jgi:hypothetical protein
MEQFLRACTFTWRRDDTFRGLWRHEYFVRQVDQICVLPVRFWPAALDCPNPEEEKDV